MLKKLRGINNQQWNLLHISQLVSSSEIEVILLFLTVLLIFFFQVTNGSENGQLIYKHLMDILVPVLSDMRRKVIEAIQS